MVLVEGIISREVLECIEERGPQAARERSPRFRVSQADQGVRLESRLAIVNHAEGPRTFVADVADPAAGCSAGSQPGPSRWAIEGRANEPPALGCGHSVDPNHRDASSLVVAEVLHWKRSRSQAATSDRLDLVHDATEPFPVVDDAGRMHGLLR